MKNVILFLSLCLLLTIGSNTIFAYTPPDSCLKLICPNDSTVIWDSVQVSFRRVPPWNPDSVRVDSCTTSPTYLGKYAKKYFGIKFKSYPFNSAIPKDSVWFVSQLKDSTTKAQFQQLELLFGPIYFTREIMIEDPDSLIIINSVVIVSFEFLQNVDTVESSFLSSLDSILLFGYFDRWKIEVITCNIPNDIALQQGKLLNDIYLNWKYENFFPINWEPFGFQSAIYEMNCPLAWEISYGNSDRIIAIPDSWEHPSEHPDVLSNFFHEQYSDGLKRSSNLLYTGHGLAVASNAIAKANNNYPIAGTCPDCKFLIPPYDDITQYDIDNSNNNIIRPVDIVNHSAGHGDYDRSHIDNGMIVVAAAGNDRKFLYSDGFSSMKYAYGVPLPDGSYSLQPYRLKSISSEVYAIPDSTDNPYADITPIVVAATKSGVLKNKYCESWGNPFVEISPNHSRDLQFLDVSNFSEGVQKFNINTNPAIRLPEKTKAFVDLVAPGSGILVAAESEPLTCSSYSPGSAAWFHCKMKTTTRVIFTVPDDVNYYLANGTPDEKNMLKGAIQDLQKYTIWNGTSHSAPFVSGIAGLMVSINEFLGVPLGTSGLPQLGRDVQRRAYNILTFTAKKIPDYENFPTNRFIQTFENIYNRQTVINGVCFYSNSFPNGEGYQYEYKPQWNDKLKRSWAQRVGFGLVNAYRAVAHSIMQKGYYEYSIGSANYTIQFNSNNGAFPIPDSRGYIIPGTSTKLMHWGSKVNEASGSTPGLFEVPQSYRGPTTGFDGEIEVLTWGGVSLPGEFHNNQGVTKITNISTPTVRCSLTVPSDCILAIDGILCSEQPELCHYVVNAGTGATAGKILMEGYLRDVELFGNLRIGDLTILSTINNGFAGIPGCIGFGSGFNSEIYGKVILKEYGLLYSWGNCVLKPGASIDMQGESDIVLNGIAEMVMEHAAEIKSSNELRKIIVNNGTTLRIPSKAVADLICEVNVKDGGSLIVDENAIVTIKKLNIENGGSMFVDEGAIVNLIDAEHICNGKLTFDGSSDNKPIITGHITEHCLPSDDPLYSDFQHILTTPRIYMKGSCTDNDKTKLVALNTIFKNISIYAENVPIPSAITNCEFYSNTRLTNPYFHLPYLLSLYYENCQECDSMSIKNVKITGCTFKDIMHPEPNPEDTENLNKSIYRTGGFQVENYKVVDISTSHFANLEYGVSSFNTDSIRISASVFDSCGVGDYDYGSNTFLCADTFNVVKYGSIRDRSDTGFVFDNRYQTTRIAYTAVASEEQRFRNNTFSEYLIGIAGSCTDLWLTDKYELGVYKLYGRNTFNITNFTFPLTNYANKFITRVCDTSVSTDIYFNKTCCYVHLACGRNQFSMYATNHLRYEGPNTYPTSIDVKYNTFFNMPVNAVRYPWGTMTLMNSTGTYIDNSQSETLDYCCGDIFVAPENYQCDQKISAPYMLCNQFVFNANKYVDINPNIVKSNYDNQNINGIFEQKYGKVFSKKSEDGILLDSKLLSYADRLINTECLSESLNQNNEIDDILLQQNSPNPFDQRSTITFYLPEAQNISMKIYNMMGSELVSLITEKWHNKGWYSVEMDSERLSSGVYIYSLISGNKVISKKMFVIK